MRQVGPAVRWSSVLGLLLAGPAPAIAQTLAVTGIEEAGAAVGRWLDLVRGGAAEAARQSASERFQYRIPENAWRNWVDRSAGALRELRARRPVETAMGRDEAPLEPLDWIRVLYASERPAGGRIYERVLAIREDDGAWRIADYAAWADPEAIVTNAAIEAIPYRFYYFHDDYHRGWRHWLFGGGPRPPDAPPVRGSTRANPKTFPRRPPG
jgi:hypothetical protein